MTQHIALSVIPEPVPNTRSVIVSTVLPVITATDGAPDVVHDCGQCKATLMEKMLPGQVSNIVILCPACHSYNDVA